MQCNTYNMRLFGVMHTPNLVLSCIECSVIHKRCMTSQCNAYTRSSVILHRMQCDTYALRLLSVIHTQNLVFYCIECSVIHKTSATSQCNTYSKFSVLLHRIQCNTAYCIWSAIQFPKVAYFMYYTRFYSGITLDFLYALH